MFDRFFLSTFKNWKKRLNSGEQDENEMDELTDVYKGRQLPGNMPAPPLPPINSNTNSLTRSVSFIGLSVHSGMSVSSIFPMQISQAKVKWGILEMTCV